MKLLLNPELNPRGAYETERHGNGCRGCDEQKKMTSGKADASEMIWIVGRIVGNFLSLVFVFHFGLRVFVFLRKMSEQDAAGRRKKRWRGGRGGHRRGVRGRPPTAWGR